MLIAYIAQSVKQHYGVSALEVFLNDMRYINPRFTYLLTYFVPLSAHSAFFVSTFEVTNSWHYTNMFIIILYIF